MQYTKGEVTGIAAAIMALLASGVGLDLANRGPHLSAAPQADVADSADVPNAAATSPSPAAAPAFTIKRVLKINEPIRYGDWHWDEAGVPAGPLVITVDLKARVLSVFRGGYEIGTTAVLVGSDVKPTPLGTFPITQKDAHHVSNIYTGAPMPYMERLTNDGVTIHGTHVRNGYASHGCIGVPTPFAKQLFETTHLGDKVVITRGKQAEVGDALI